MHLVIIISGARSPFNLQGTVPFSHMGPHPASTSGFHGAILLWGWAPVGSCNFGTGCPVEVSGSGP